MARRKNIAIKRRTYSSHAENDILNAVKAVKDGNMSVRKAAERYKIPKSTLYDKISGKTAIGARMGRKPVIPDEIEKNMVETAMRSSDRGFGLSRRQILIRAGILCRKLGIKGFKNETPSKHYWEGLKKRHPDMSLRKPEKLATTRAKMLNPTVVENYFRDLEKIVTDLNLKNNPEFIWNCDETGKQLEHNPINVVARKGSRSVVGRTSTDRSNISIMACVNAAGIVMPPMVIVKGKTHRSLYGFNTKDAPQNTIWTFSKKAWMEDSLSEQWFRDVFLKNCGNHRPQLLILDGHGSHETLGLLQLAESENIFIMALPPHTTHHLQPLDKAVFAPFNKAYDRECSEFLSEHTCNSVNKWTFPGIFRKAWEEGLTKETLSVVSDRVVYTHLMLMLSHI